MSVDFSFCKSPMSWIDGIGSDKAAVSFPLLLLIISPTYGLLLACFMVGAAGVGILFVEFNGFEA